VNFIRGKTDTIEAWFNWAVWLSAGTHFAAHSTGNGGGQRVTFLTRNPLAVDVEHVRRRLGVVYTTPTQRQSRAKFLTPRRRQGNDQYQHDHDISKENCNQVCQVQ
jgi:hypothetical protein